MNKSISDIKCVYDIQGEKLSRRIVTRHDLEFFRVYLKEDKKHFGYWVRSEAIDIPHGCYFSSRKAAINAIKQRLQEELNRQTQEIKQLQKRNKILVANIKKWSRL